MNLISSILFLSLSVFAEEDQCVDKLDNCDTLKEICETIPATQVSCPVTCGTCGQKIPDILDLPQFSDTLCEDSLPGMCENIDQATCLSHEKFLNGCKKSCNNCDGKKTIGESDQEQPIDILKTKETLEKFTNLLNEGEGEDSDDSDAAEVSDSVEDDNIDANSNNVAKTDSEETTVEEPSNVEDKVDTDSKVSEDSKVVDDSETVEDSPAEDTTGDAAVADEAETEETSESEETTESEETNETEEITETEKSVDQNNETDSTESESNISGARPSTGNSGIRFTFSFVLGLISMSILMFV